MVVVFFTVASLGLGVGMGTVLAKHLATKRAPYTFEWKSKRYEVREVK